LASKHNRVKGSIFETDVMKWLRKAGVLAERLTKAGSKDEGDMVVVIAGKSYILELKNRATLSLPEFWREAEVEALNYANARGIGEVPLHYVVVKRRNAGIENSVGYTRSKAMAERKAIMGRHRQDLIRWNWHLETKANKSFLGKRTYMHRNYMDLDSLFLERFNFGNNDGNTRRCYY
jgi:Holliday junction resolvase